MKLGDGVSKPVGTWDYYGIYDPAHCGRRGFMDTFSVGIFQWVHAAGNRTKKSKARRRISGPVSQPEAVYSKVLAHIKTLEISP